MPAPTFVAEYEAVFNTATTPKTVSVTTAVGDVLVIASAAESESVTLNLPTGGTPTYTNLETPPSVGSYCAARIDGAITGITAQTYTLSQTVSGTQFWGFTSARFSGSDGFGAAESVNGTAGSAPSLAITTTQDNSALLVIVGDWNAADGTTRTWRTINGLTPTAGNGQELVYFRDSARYTVYCAYYPDVGAAGAKTVGLTAPATQKPTVAVVEIKGTTSAATFAPPIDRGRSLRPLLVR